MRALSPAEAPARLIGLCAVVFGGALASPLVPWPSSAARLCFLAAWLGMAALLLAHRRVRFAAILLAVLCATGLLGPLFPMHQPLALFLWAGVILAVTEGRPAERILLLKVMATVVYAFAALSKLNPAFLAGDQLLAIVRGRAHWDFLVPVMAGPAGLILSWLGVLLEAAVPAGLWHPRTRRLAVGVGLCLHLGFVLLVTRGSLPDLTHLVALNGLLLACYPAFFARPAERAGAEEEGAVVLKAPARRLG